MASPVPAKSQSLHNFPLPHLKCKKNRSRLADPSPHQSPPSDAARLQSAKHNVPAHRSPIHHSSSRRSPMHSSALIRDVEPRQSPMRGSENWRNSAPDNTVGNGHTAPTPFSGHVTERIGKRLKISEGKEAGLKIHIKPQRNTADEIQEEKNDEIKTCMVEGEVQESMPKTWNFRPRKPLYKANYANGGGTSKIGGSTSQEIKAHLPQVSEAVDGEEKEKKQKFSIALSKEEIEEDVFAMTGSKPARRPKKRPRNVRKTLDNLFPGCWLASITPDSYKVYENPTKG